MIRIEEMDLISLRSALREGNGKRSFLGTMSSRELVEIGNKMVAAEGFILPLVYKRALKFSKVLSGQRLKGKSVGDRDMSLEFDDYVRGKASCLNNADFALRIRVFRTAPTSSVTIHQLEALKDGMRDKVVLATKFGCIREEHHTGNGRGPVSGYRSSVLRIFPAVIATYEINLELKPSGVSKTLIRLGRIGFESLAFLATIFSTKSLMDSLAQVAKVLEELVYHGLKQENQPVTNPLPANCS
ncbi:unnamed protein product [Arabidopsis lyrata]|nr:unnamed protein product [Arabidopsis lyrata]